MPLTRAMRTRYHLKHIDRFLAYRLGSPWDRVLFSFPTRLNGVGHEPQGSPRIERGTFINYAAIRPSPPANYATSEPV